MSPAPLVPTVEDAPDLIMPVALPTPFPVGAVNCYLLLDEPVTLVDPGLLWADSVSLLEAALRSSGLGLGNVDQVVVTHSHPDYFGAARWLAERADATVVRAAAERPKLVGAWQTLLSGGVADRLGIPDHIRDAIDTFSGRVAHIAHPVAENRLVLLDDGDHLRAGGREWRVEVTPGHSVGRLALFDPETRVLVSGDHLLACITPNPVLEPEASSPDGGRRSLPEYLASLERFERIPPRVVLPGHGPRSCGVPTLTAATRRHHDRRADEIVDLLGRQGASTAYELAGILFPHVEKLSVLLGVSELVSHFDLLENIGRIAHSSEPPYHYSVV